LSCRRKKGLGGRIKKAAVSKRETSEKRRSLLAFGGIFDGLLKKISCLRKRRRAKRRVLV